MVELNISFITVWFKVMLTIKLLWYCNWKLWYIWKWLSNCNNISSCPGNREITFRQGENNFENTLFDKMGKFPLKEIWYCHPNSIVENDQQNVCSSQLISYCENTDHKKTVCLGLFSWNVSQNHQIPRIRYKRLFKSLMTIITFLYYIFQIILSN